MTNKLLNDLTDRLKRALDDNYEITDMDMVFSVITSLEGLKVTKEQLESTRLAKFINQLRRRTKNESLARRAKALLKAWRDMVGILSQNASAGDSNPPNTFSTTQKSKNSAVKNNASTSSSNVFPSSDIQRVTIDDSSLPPIFNFAETQRAASDASAHAATSNFNVRKDNNNQPSRSEFSTFLNIDSNSQFAKNEFDMKYSGAHIKQQLANLSTDQNKNLNRFSTLHENNAYVHSTTATSKENNSKAPNSPIVINIEDSDSESGIQSMPVQEPISVPLSKRKKDTAETLPVSKHKKNKRDKRRKKDSDFQVQSHQNQKNAIRNFQAFEPKNEEFVGRDEQSLSNIETNNISEILSLSNSSMSSFFPNSLDDRSRKFTKQSNVQKPPSLNSNFIPSSDLTFSGKIQHCSQSSDAPNIAVPESSSYRDGLDETDKDLRFPHNFEQKTVNKPITIDDKIITITCNSNDSFSGSRHDYRTEDNSKELQQQKFVDCAKEMPATSSKSAAGNLPEKSVEQKTPKKRGRKKGSKGVDSLIAKEISLSAQMMVPNINSGNKKVKTTKELYADIQNKNFNSTLAPASLSTIDLTEQRLEQPVRPNSSCSEPSSESVQNAAAVKTEKYYSRADNGRPETDSDTVSSGESLTTQRDPKALGTESNSSSLLSGKTQKSEALSAARDEILRKLHDLLAKMPKPPSVRELEAQYNADTTPCTCQVLECEQKEPENGGDANSVGVDQKLLANIKKEEPESPSASTFLSSHEGPQTVTENLPDIQLKTEESPPPPAAPKPKKSIFDLDFDDDEDPLQAIKAEVEAEVEAESDRLDVSLAKGPEALGGVAGLESGSIKLESNLSFVKIEDNYARNELESLEVANSMPILPAYPRYHIVEDPDCKAKLKFEVQPRMITKFHINAMLNFYIPNVNGNWDDAKISLDTVKLQDSELEASNIVPSVSTDRLPKNLSNLQFLRKATSRNLSRHQFIHKRPFLGAARSRLVRKWTTKSQVKTEESSAGEKDCTDANDENGHENEISNPTDTAMPHTSADLEVAAESHRAETADIQELPSILSKDRVVEAAHHEFADVTMESINETPTSEDPVEENQFTLEVRPESNNIYTDGDAALKDGYAKEIYSSSSEDSSLRYNQGSINLKLRRQKKKRKTKTLGSSVEEWVCSKRKRRRKKNLEREDAQKKVKKSQTKVLKIAINGDVSTERSITIFDSSDPEDSSASTTTTTDYDSQSEDNLSVTAEAACAAEPSETKKYSENCAATDEYEEDEENNCSNNFHEVITRHISAKTNFSNNHIVLTIKKTSAKLKPNTTPAAHPTASETSSVDQQPNSQNANNVSTESVECSSTNSPKAALDLNGENGLCTPTSPLSSLEIQEIDGDLATQTEVEATLSYQLVDPPRPAYSYFTSRRSGVRKSKHNLKSIANVAQENSAKTESKERKLHKRLFFSWEIAGISGISSCSSSCSEADDIADSSSGDEYDNEKRMKLLRKTLMHLDSYIQRDTQLENSMKRRTSVSSTSSSSSSSSCSSSEKLDVSQEEDSSEKCQPEGAKSTDSIEFKLNQPEYSLKSLSKHTEDIGNDDLAEENNGMLASFNNLKIRDKSVKVHPLRESLQNDVEAVGNSSNRVGGYVAATHIKNCDAVQGNNNNNDCSRISLMDSDVFTGQLLDRGAASKFDVIKYGAAAIAQTNNNEIECGAKATGDIGNQCSQHSHPKTIKDENEKPTAEKQLQLMLLENAENETGFRIVDEDVYDDNGESCARVQRFKEWHEVLQLRSYNDELLTVLPYVVLD